MNSRETTRQRFLRDNIAKRLGNLGSNLARISSFTKYDEMKETALAIVDESLDFISWTTDELGADEQNRLNEFRDELLNWKSRWENIWNDKSLRSAIGLQAQQYSEQLLMMMELE